MRLSIPFIPLSFRLTVERRPWRRLTIFGLMVLIAILGIGLGLVRFSERRANDWAIDRRAAARHAHEALFYAQMLKNTRVYQLDHPREHTKTWVIHGLQYRVDQDLDRYLEAMVDYHKRQAGRHEAAIGRWWYSVASEAPPAAPPRVPFD